MHATTFYLPSDNCLLLLNQDRIICDLDGVVSRLSRLRVVPSLSKALPWRRVKTFDYIPFRLNLMSSSARSWISDRNRNQINTATFTDAIAISSTQRKLDSIQSESLKSYSLTVTKMVLKHLNGKKNK